MKKRGTILLCVMLSLLLLLTQGCGSDGNDDTNTKENHGWTANKYAEDGNNDDDKTENEGWVANQNVKDISFGDYIVRIEGCRSEGKVLFVKFKFTNNSSEPATFSQCFGAELYQNGASLTFCYAGTAGLSMSSQVKPGVSLELESSFILNDIESDVEIPFPMSQLFE